MKLICIFHQNQTPEQKNRVFQGISSFTLHIIAMLLMLCDHLWATILFQYDWLTWVGRLAYPIFAFMLVEGYFHTRNLKKYLGRLLFWAILSELPFNLMYGGGLLYPYHQNVLWTFLLGLLFITGIEKMRHKGKPLLTMIVCSPSTVISPEYFGKRNACGVITPPIPGKRTHPPCKCPDKIRSEPHSL